MTTPDQVRNLVLLAAGRLVSQWMTALFNFAQSLYVLDLTGSASAFGAVLIAGLVPRALLSFVAGIAVDHGRKKHILVGCDVLAGLAVFGFLAFFEHGAGSVAFFVALSFLLGAINTFFILAVQAATPELVGAELVPRANAVQETLRALSGILGPLLGALAYTQLGMEAIFLTNGVSFLASAGLELFLRVPRGEKRIEPAESRPSISASLAEAGIFLERRGDLRRLFGVAIVAQMLFEPMTRMVLPFMIYQVLALGAFQLSLVQATAAASVILAAVLVSGKKKHPDPLPLFVPLLLVQGLLFMAWALPAAGVGLSAWTLTVLFAVLQVAGRMCNTFQNLPLFSFFQLEIPERIRGRLFGLFYTLTLLLVPPSLWLFGMILEHFHWTITPLLAGFLIAVLAILASRWMKPHWIKPAPDAADQTLTVDQAGDAPCIPC